MRLRGLILAGGEGRRFGHVDKAFLQLSGEALVSRMAARLSGQLDGVAISANGDPTRFSGLGLPVLSDGILAGFGPLAGLLSGLRWARAEGAEALVSVAVDTPFFPLDLVARLTAATRNVSPGMAMPAPVLAENATGLHPTFGLWPVAALGPLAQALMRGERRIGVFAGSIGACRVWFDDAPDPFFNINTPDDLAAATARLAGEQAPGIAPTDRAF